MSLDINRKLTQKNAFRLTKKRNKTALRIRVPGGHLETKYFELIHKIAQEYGNGTVHITTRQGFEIPDIDFSKMNEINSLITPLIEGMEIQNGVEILKIGTGYPAAGTRNIAACIGNRVCPFANYDTTTFAKRMEKEVYPNDLHVKIAITGCPNDCIKAHLQDFGVIGMTEPQYSSDDCIACEACVKTCKRFVTDALKMHKGKVVRDADRCIGCGECVLKCPTSAWTRSEKKFYRLIIMGRTGKKSPRLAQVFLNWASEEMIFYVIKQTYVWVDKYIDKSLPKEHVGYIVDREGFASFKDWVLKDAPLNPEIQVVNEIPSFSKR